MTTFRLIFGEEGFCGTTASSKVVTSDTLVTAIIFSAATSFKPFAIRAASCGSGSDAVMDKIRVSAGTATETFLASSVGVISNFNSSIAWFKTF